MPESPLIRENISNASSIVWKGKFIVWGGSVIADGFPLDHPQLWRNEGAIYDIKKDGWEKMEEAPIQGRAGSKLMILEDDKLII
jgi:hypothetical protein